MSDKNFMAYGDAETILTGYANGINANKKNLSDISYEYYIRNGLKNLAVINQESSSMNTIKFTNNGDGTWTVNGTNSKDTSAYAFPMIVEPGYFKPGRYTLTGIPSGVSDVSLVFRYNNESGNKAIARVDSYTLSNTFDLTAAQVAAATNNFNLMILVQGSATVNNVTVSPMLVYEEAGLISSAFEKAGKTNKELESEKVSWEDYSKSGVKNYLKLLDTIDQPSGCTITNNGDGTLTLNGTCSSTTVVKIAGTTNLSSTEKYILSGCPAGGGTSTGGGYLLGLRTTADGSNDTVRYKGSDVIDIGNACFFDTANIFATTSGNQVNIQASTTGIYLRLNTGNSYDNLVFKPMIRLASDSDETFYKYAMTNKELTKAVDDLNFHLTQSATLSTSAATTVTFTNAKITTDCVVDLGFSEWGIVPDDVVVASGSCTVTLPQVDSAKTISVTLFVKSL